jgi:predicted DsbA family dithiol-disulfide isomerase
MLIILVPENEHQEFGQIVQQVGVAANFVGLKWDVESIIARRAGFYADEAGPF